ncbi:hypothetical protein ARTHRO9V_280309 [Arthrobacter sp. 9V]|nr:hypothetical protein ARTHRO9V_280309 [Arthrobacter sp. 9V]
MLEGIMEELTRSHAYFVARMPRGLGLRRLAGTQAIMGTLLGPSSVEDSDYCRRNWTCVDMD